MPSVCHTIPVSSTVSYAVEAEWTEDWYNDETDVRLLELSVYRDAPGLSEILNVPDDMFYEIDVNDADAVRAYLEAHGIIRPEDLNPHVAQMRALLTP